MLNRAVAAQQAGRLTEANGLLKGIVTRYPNTLAGRQAKSSRAKIQGHKVQMLAGGRQAPRPSRTAQPTRSKGKTRGETIAKINSRSKPKAKDREPEQPQRQLLEKLYNKNITI